MLVILLAALGVSLWVVAALALALAWSRRRTRRAPGVFACRVRPAGPAASSDRWPRSKRYAYWVHDVLLVHHGPALLRYDALAVASVIGPSRATTAKGLGDRPMCLRLHLDDGRLYDIVARNHDVGTAIGPFVAASML